MGRLFLILILFLLIAVPACGPRPASVSGVWIGTWVSADGESTGRFRVEVSQRGKAIKGPIELSLDWLPRARIEGVVEGQRVRWGVLRGGLVILTFEGTVSGDTAAGRYSFGQAGEGSWIARRERRRWSGAGSARGC
jgi:hypothetical protein